MEDNRDISWDIAVANILSVDWENAWSSAANCISNERIMLKRNIVNMPFSKNINMAEPYFLVSKSFAVFFNSALDWNCFMSISIPLYFLYRNASRVSDLALRFRFEPLVWHKSFTFSGLPRIKRYSQRCGRRIYYGRWLLNPADRDFLRCSI